jgi:hypothetical protein
MRAKLHMYAMKFKPAVKKYWEEWRKADPYGYEDLYCCLRTSYMGYFRESSHADKRNDDQ